MKVLYRVTYSYRRLLCALLVMVTPLVLYTSKAQHQNTPMPVQQEIIEPLVLTVTVTDKSGRYIQGLDKASFTVLDDKVPQEIIHLDNKETPISVGIILDASLSIAQTHKRDVIKAGLGRFVQLSNDSDEYFLLGFNERPQLLLDWTRDGKTVLDKINSLQFKGQTALYDACYLGIEKVMSGAHKKRVLLLISDGLDTSSRFYWKELQNFLKKSDVLIYAVGLFKRDDLHTTMSQEGLGILDGFTLTTGGNTFIPQSAKEANQVFELIAQELRLQYSVGFKAATSAKENNWHRIKVTVTPPSSAPRKTLPLKVRSREGYYTTKETR
jgi:Ca-activated chloride channel family protein